MEGERAAQSVRRMRNARKPSPSPISAIPAPSDTRFTRCTVVVSRACCESRSAPGAVLASGVAAGAGSGSVGAGGASGCGSELSTCANSHGESCRPGRKRPSPASRPASGGCTSVPGGSSSEPEEESEKGSEEESDRGVRDGDGAGEAGAESAGEPEPGAEGCGGPGGAGAADPPPGGTAVGMDEGSAEGVAGSAVDGSAPGTPEGRAVAPAEVREGGVTGELSGPVDRPDDPCPACASPAAAPSAAPAVNMRQATHRVGREGRCPEAMDIPSHVMVCPASRCSASVPVASA